MPTFDFANIIRKVVSVAITVACNPVTIVIAAAGIIAGLLADFGQAYALPTISVPENIGWVDSSGLLELVLYCINYSALVSIINFTFSSVVTIINFSLRFAAGLLTVVTMVAAYRAVRSKIKDFTS